MKKSTRKPQEQLSRPRLRETDFKDRMNARKSLEKHILQRQKFKKGLVADYRWKPEGQLLHKKKLNK